MSLLFYFLFAGLIGALCGKSKGQPGLGFIIGVVLGPIGWIISLLSGDVRPKCNACRKVVDPKASICPYCRTAIAKKETARDIVSFVRTEPSLRRTVAPKTA
jgi:hypothetical protein